MIPCKNHNDPDVTDCLGYADDRFTMDFDDVVPGEKLYWCENCGPRAHAMVELIHKAIENRPGFEEEFVAAMDAVEDGGDA